MSKWLKDLDLILRGDATQLSSLRRGSVELSLGGLSLLIALLGMLYGLCMGSYALFKVGGPSYVQVLASMTKVPLLFFLTLAVTFPSLYVFNALVGSRLLAISVLQLIIAAFGVMLAVLASFGPIVAFFSVSTTSYPFMLLLNVGIFSIAGFLGLKFLLLTLHRISVLQSEMDSSRQVQPRSQAVTEGESEPSLGALDWMEGHVMGRSVRTVFRLWVIVFALVGAQMGWVLRPFIGDPNSPFSWFRLRESNFFQAVFTAFRHLFS